LNSKTRTIDELMGYEPQMTDEDIRKLYKEITEEFAAKPYDEVIDHCRDITKKYFSCFPLLYQIALLFVRYSQTDSIIEEAKELVIRVKEQSDDVSLKQVALNLEAACELILGNPSRVIDLLQDGKKYMTSPSSNEILLSEAYKVIGKTKEAKSKLQGTIFNNLFGLINIMPSYLSICADDINCFEEIYNRMFELIETFKIKESMPFATLPFYEVAAQGYLLNKNLDKCLDMLEAYTDIVTNNSFSQEIDSFFGDILPEKMADRPLDEQSEKQYIIDAVVANPAYSDLTGNKRFIDISKRLKNIC